MAEVTFIQDFLMRNLKLELRKWIKGRFKKGHKVCIKAHMGEPEGLKYIRPSIIGLISRELKVMGAEPFLFDSPVAYEGERDTPEKYLESCRKNGFTKEVLDCPVLISDTGTKIKTEHFEIEACKPLVEADGIIVVSHFKGHRMTVFGGCLKNIGMGATTKNSKNITHAETRSKISELNKCTGCGLCVKLCPIYALEIKNNKVQFVRNCLGCGICYFNCPNKVFSLHTVSLGEAMAEISNAILKKFGHKQLHINCAIDITETCDCVPRGKYDASPVVAPDVGFFISDDPIACDKAAFDEVNKATNEAFGNLHKIPPLVQLKYGEKLGLGTTKYKINKVKGNNECAQ